MKAERLASGNYRCKVYLGKDSTGKKAFKSITGVNKKAVEAEASRYALLNRAEVGQTVGHAIDQYIATREATKSPATIRGYIAQKRHLERDFGYLMGKPVHSVTTHDLQCLVDAMTATNAPKTVTNITAMVYSSLREAGCVIDRPKLPQKVRPVYKIPSEDTVRAVIEAAKGTELEIPIMLAAFGPLRRGEIAALSLDDIDGNVIHVHHSMVRDKNGKWQIKPPKTVSSDRYIQMMPEVIELIQSKGYVTKMNPNTITRRFEEFLESHGFPKFRFHDLRHWSASYMHGKGVPDIYIMQRTGHADNSTLRNVYTHTLQDQSEIETEHILNSFRGNFRGNSARQIRQNSAKNDKP